MNRKANLLLAGLVLFVVTGALTFGLNTGNSSGTQSDICQGKSGFDMMVHIHDGKVSNVDVKGRLCDKITFMNEDAVTREVGFGSHDEHQPYDGVGEKVLNIDSSFTITLNQTGKFHWHDHLHDEVEGYFTVSQ